MEILKHVKIDDEFIDSAPAYFSVIEPIWQVIKFSDDWNTYNESLKNLSEAQINVIAVASHLGEVCNGGHCQFFFNPTGIVWSEALAGYKAIGLKNIAVILQEAIDRLGGTPSPNRAERESQLQAAGDEFDDLDDRFFEIEKTDLIYEAIMRYIQEHREEFYFEGDVPDYSLPDIHIN